MKNKVKYITHLGILVAILMVLQYVSNYIKFGAVNINLGLIVIIIGACVLGPMAGLCLGIVNGIITCLAPDTSLFLAHNVLMTIIVCLAKTGLAGLACGLIFKLLNKFNNYVAVLVSSITVPIINTGIFLIGAMLFFLPVYGGGSEGLKVLLTTTLTINFLIEFVVTIVFSFVIHRLIILVNKKQI